MENNIHVHAHTVTQEERHELMSHKPVVLWFTGLSASGKSTVANEVDQMLHEFKVKTYVLDGDNVRSGLNNNLGFTDEDRKENIRRIGEVAKLFNDAGVVVLSAFISPFKEDRDIAREIIGDGFIEIYVEADLAVCEARDPKGLYKKARAGKIPHFTGIDSPYEAPTNPEFTINTGEQDATRCATEIVRYLTDSKKLRLK